MKKLLLLALPLLLLTGCGDLGEGQTIGYIYAVDDGAFWDRVWYRSDLTSSEEICYMLEEDDEMKAELRELMDGQKLKLYYDRHASTLGCSLDEITSYEVLDVEAPL